MKKLAILTITVLGLGYSGMNVVSGQQAAVESTPVQSAYTTGNLSSVIDDIEVPQEVLEYVQLTYDGHAVTKADKVIRDGQDMYRLRVDRDDQLNDANSVALLFTMDWKLVGTERASAPPAPKVTPEPKEEQPATTPSQPSPETTEEAPQVEEKPVGGSGQGTEQPEEPADEETPSTAPVEESNDSTQ